MNRPRVAILTTAFPPIGGGGVMRMAKLAKYLPERGWDITVVRSDEADYEVADPRLVDEIPDAVRVRTLQGPFRPLGARAKRVTDAGAQSGISVGRAVTRAGKAAVRSVLIPDRYLGWAWRVSRLDHSELDHADVILSSGPPHSVHLAAARLARRLSLPLVVDLRDDWAGNPMHLSVAPWHRPLEGRLERRCVTRATRVVHVSEASCAALKARYPGLAPRFEAIPNGFDPEDLAGLADRTPASPGRPVRFLYAGSLRGTQDVGDFLEVFGATARAEAGTRRLDLVGPIGPPFRALAQAAVDSAHLGISDPVPHADALRAMAATDVLVLFTGGGGSGDQTMTGKLYEYLAVRRPILLVGPPGPAAELVETSGAGIAVDPRDRAGLHVAIARVSALAADPAYRGAPDDVLARFDRRGLAERWADLLGDALREGVRR